MRGAALALGMLLAPHAARADDTNFAAERAFAELLLGLHSADPCANISRGARSCPPGFAERQMTFVDDKAAQTYRFEENRCIVHADTRITATGERYVATFNLQNVLYVNLNKAQQEGNLKEVELYLQGRNVLETGGKTGNVLTFIHKYYAADDGDIGHDVKREVLDMREALKDYQTRFCGGMG